MVRIARSVARPAGPVTSWLQRRPAIAALRRVLRIGVPKPRWSSVFWTVAVAGLVVVVVTGVVLALFYDPSTRPTRYDGGFAPLHGAEVSRAFASTLGISFDLPGGLLIRQLHGWGASLAIAALLVHILKVFFTGGFRGRRLTWLLLFGVLFASMGAGLSGVVLPDDLASGSSLAVLDGILKAVPVVGTWASYLVFRGEGPGGAIATLYPVHVVLLPLAIAAMVVVVIVLSVRRRSGPHPVARPHLPLVPLATVVALRIRVVVIIVAVLVIVAATVTINPVWAYGPADPGNASAGIGAVWYLAFLDGAQRLVPPGWEVVLFDRTWTLAILVPVAVCGLFFLVAALYPFAEAWVLGSRGRTSLPDRPRNVPARTALGVAGVVFFGVLWAAAGSDVLATQFRLGLEGVVLALQLALVLGPVIAFALTRRICLGLQERDREAVLHGYESGRIVRMPGGSYVERHAPLGPAALARIAESQPVDAPMLRPRPDGRIAWTARARALLARGFFRDPVLLPAARERRPIGEGEDGSEVVMRHAG